jgi:HD-GYP domain-containing protein (c-di-GMP phosphodiesterase class II)
MGAAAVGVCGGVVFALLRQRRFRLVVINCAQYVVAAVAAAVAYEALRPIALALAIAAAGALFAVVNAGLILLAIVAEYRRRPSDVLSDMWPALPNYLAFGLLGILVGEFYSSMGALALVLLLTPILVGRATFAAVLEQRHSREATIKVFLRAIEMKDTYTARHTERVCTYSLYIGQELGFSRTRLEQLRQSALMHDIGKLAVPKHLLTKPARLTDDEFAAVQRHAHVCIDILELVDFMKPMVAAAAGHHARFDGGGYGGTGEYPLEAYVVATADAYDAMTSTRSYRRALPQDVAFAELRAKSGTQFHPDCVDALINAIEKRGEKHGAGYEESVIDFDVPPPTAGVGSACLGDLERSPAVAGERQ